VTASSDATSAAGTRLARLYGLVRHVIDQADEHDADVAAAGLAFYGLLGFFPALLAIVSMYGLVADPVSVAAALSSLARALPPSARETVMSGLAAFVERPSGSLGMSFGLSLLAVLWSASSAMSVLVRVINAAYGIRERRSFFARRRLAVLFTLAGVLGVSVAVPVVVLTPKLFHVLRADTLTIALPWVVLALGAFVAVLGLFRFAPYRRPPHLHSLVVGALLTSVSWLVVSGCFSLYVRYVARFGSTYGALEGVIVLEFWLYVSALVLLYGTELAAELERRWSPSPPSSRGVPASTRAR
jgi:membrane protein